MDYKIYLLIIISLIFFIKIFYLLNFYYIFKDNNNINASNENCIYIPAISKDHGIITEFCLRIYRGTGKVFIEIPNVFSSIYQNSYIISKAAACKVIENCNEYDYIFYTKSHFNGEGFSGTAGLSALILYTLNNKSLYTNKLSITGFILPNGLIISVGGIPEKLKASEEKNLILIAPSNYSNNILQVYTILDLKKIFYNYTDLYFEVPKKYYTILKEIASDICQNIEDTDIITLFENNSFYTAASFCFIKKSESLEVNISKEELEKEILELENIVKNYKCKTYICEELKFQVLLRINMSKDIENISKKYWRFYTAKGWYKMLLNFDKIERKDTCKIVDEDYKIMKYIINEELPEDLSCFEKREVLSRLYYNLFSIQNIDMNVFLDSVEKYLNYLYRKNGFSVTSYNYYTYGKDLIRIGRIADGILYLIYAINYAI